ncbi:cupin domain-containing protein [Streptomyces sp. NPDC045470]|uniref:cupin domain-containing protein n=1 Tax=Streptomyces sp. NPDC045470 TaxID=3155469 RepID=UPI00340B3E08
MTFVSLAERLGRDTFPARVLHRDYRHVPGALSEQESGALCSFDTINDVIATHRLEPPRLRLSAGGEMLAPHRYAVPVVTRRSTVWQRTHPAELHERLADGASLVVDAIDELHAPIGALAQGLEGWLRTHVQVNAYASWTSTEGFGTHWDDHDVIVVQVAGAKRWRLFGLTRTAPMYRDVAEPEGPPPGPVADLVLHPGDVLYLPRGWWHAVTADQGSASLHLTCGIGTHTGADLIRWLSDELRASDRVRSDLPVHRSAEEQHEYLAALGKEMAAALEGPELLSRYAAAQDADDLGRLRPSLPQVNGALKVPGARVRLTTGRGRLDVTADAAVFTAAGHVIEFAPAAAPLLRHLLTAPAGAWITCAELAGLARLPLGDVAAVVGELVQGQAATLAAEQR